MTFLKKSALYFPDKIKNASLETHNFDIDNFEANCILEVAILLIQDAQTQIANKGVFYNCDLV